MVDDTLLARVGNLIEHLCTGMCCTCSRPAGPIRIHHNKEDDCNESNCGCSYNPSNGTGRKRCWSGACYNRYKRRGVNIVSITYCYRSLNLHETLVVNEGSQPEVESD